MNSFKIVCVYVVFAVTLIASRAPLFAAPGPERPQEGRLLFVIETSAATDNDRSDIRKSIRSIIESGLDGHMKYGDTIGVWTYGEKVNTDFPMVMWTHEHLQDAEGAIDYWMMKQKFKGRANFNNVLPPLQKVIRSSDKLTVVWYSSGDGQITGTPFDKEIAELHKEFRKDFRKQHIPFITILAVRNGAVVDFTVNPGDAKVRLPDVFAKEDAAAAQAAANTPPPQPAPPPVKRPPLIIHVGPSPELVAQEKAKAAAAAAAAAVAASNNATAQKVTTNAVAAVQPAVQTNAPAAVSTTATPAAKPSMIAAATAQTNAVVTPKNAPAVAATNAAVSAVVKSNPPPVAAVAPPNNDSNGTAKPAPAAEKQKSTVSKATSAGETPTVTPTAAAVVSPEAHYNLFIAIGCAILALGTGLIFFFVKQSNAPKGPSFISQSMTRERFNSDASKPSSDKPAGPE